MEQAAGSPPQGEARRPGPGQRPRSYKTEAAVLRAFPVLEADRPVPALTPSLGPLTVPLPGARASTRKKICV